MIINHQGIRLNSQRKPEDYGRYALAQGCPHDMSHSNNVAIRQTGVSAQAMFLNSAYKEQVTDIMSEELKKQAAAAALTFVEDGMKLGIGTGSTAEQFIRLLAEKVANGLKVVGVPTSERSARLCEELNVPLTTLDETPHLDLTIDGADEIDAQLRLIKGGGGAHLREKIVAAASDKMVVIADASKIVKTLGQFRLPIEVMPFGLGATTREVNNVCAQFGLQGQASLRMNAEGERFITDGQHYILDAPAADIADVEGLDAALRMIPGVVETGFFIGIATNAVVAAEGGIEVLRPE